VWLVADVDGVNPRDLSFSADVTRTHGGERWTLRSVALCGRPAMNNVGRVSVVDARDLDALGDTEILLLDREQPFLAQVLRRAKEHQRTRRAGAPLILDDEHQLDGLVRGPAGGLFRNDELVTLPRRSASPRWLRTPAATRSKKRQRPGGPL
jgi:hypothetical protein